MNEPTPDLLVTRNLQRAFREGGCDLQVLRGINLSVKQGEMLAILGASGSGKSTLLHLLGGFDRPTAGSVLYHNNDIYKLGNARLDHYRNAKVGFVFQFYHLLPELTALENVQIAAMIRRSSLSRKARRARATLLLERVGLKDRLKHRPSKLSGGERQRVAIARALMNKPEVLLADEPTGNLDRETGQSILNLLHELHQEDSNANGTMVIVTHDEHVAERANRVLTLEDGQLI